MALQKTVTTSFGLEIPDAYHRVEYVTINSAHVPSTTPDGSVTHPRNSTIYFQVNSYVNGTEQQYFQSLSKTCPYDITSTDNPVKQAYNYLKSLPEFADAIDI